MGFANVPDIIPSSKPDPTTPNPEFGASGTYATAQAQTEIQEAAPVGSSYHITNIVVSTEVAGWIALVSVTSAGTVELIPPIYLGDNASGGPVYTTPVLVPTGCNICVESSIVGNHSVMVNGYLAG